MYLKHKDMKNSRQVKREELLKFPSNMALCIKLSTLILFTSVTGIRLHI